MGLVEVSVGITVVFAPSSLTLKAYFTELTTLLKFDIRINKRNVPERTKSPPSGLIAFFAFLFMIFNFDFYEVNSIVA